MKITDKEVKRQLNIVNMPELEESVYSYPEDERGGRSDMQILADECSYFVSMYSEGGTVYSDDYENALEYIRETKRGTRFTVDPNNTVKSLARAKNKYEQAKAIVNEYKRLCNLKKRLEAKGYYGKW